MRVNIKGERDPEYEGPIEDQPADTWWGDLTDWLGDIRDQGLDTICAGKLDFEVAWRCANIDSENWFDTDNWYDIPPDHYRYQYGSTRLPDSNYSMSAYYQDIKLKVSDERILNYFNTADAALQGWNMQQMTKPDRTWTHHKEIANGECDSGAIVPGDGEVCLVEDLYASDRADGDEYDLQWPGDKNAILAHILPSRTFAMGATAGLAGNGEILGELDLRGQLGFNHSNYDHSAQWLSDNPARHTYWEEFLKSTGLSNAEESNTGE